MDVADVILHRQCSWCGILRPLDEFRKHRASRDDRRSQCNACHRKAERERIRLKGRARDRARAQRFARQLSRLENWHQVSRLCAAIIQQFGDRDKLVAAFIETFDYLRTEKPGSARTLAMFTAILRLSHFCELNPPSTDDLTDNELKLELYDSALEILLQRPEFIFAAAARKGWTVVPPPDWRPRGAKPVTSDTGESVETKRDTAVAK